MGSRLTPRPRISSEEFRDRRARLAGLAEQRGWPGVGVLGRGGGTYDRHGDLMYLTGHYQGFVHLPDRAPQWSGRSHALLVLPVDGEPTLLCSAPGLDPVVDLDDIRVTADFPRDATALLSQLGGGGFSGFDVAPAAWARMLPRDRFEPAETTIESLRRRKSPAEVELLRYACQVGSDAMTALIGGLTAGLRESDAVADCIDVAVRGGAVPYGVSLITGDARTRGAGARPFPGYRHEHRIQRGDPASADMTIVYEGYYCDFARSWVVGGSGLVPAMDELIGALSGALDTAVAAAVPGAPALAIPSAGAAALPAGAEPSYPHHWGHGLGMGWEGPFLLPDNHEVLEEDMTLAVELGLASGDLSAYGEHDILITADGPEALTRSSWGPS
jgi:Xaa-Pro aminopeptidase